MKTALDPIFANLNADQRLAVETTEGPVLILAGAGSGKTRALTHRIAYLIQKGIPPWQILAVTFTNKAANEMKERIKSLLGVTQPDSGLWLLNSPAAKLPVMGTFHSVCARILRRDIEHLGRDRHFVIYDSDDQEKMMKDVLKKMNISESELKPRAALGYVGRFKCEAVSPREAQNQATTPRMQRIIAAYTQYEKALREANAVDFDDLILETVRLFVEVPEVLERYQKTWRYLHIDEYQDTNHAQYLLVSLLARGHQNLCAIGDPDQSIYAFRGADVRNILEFEKEYPKAVRIKLEQNYRSVQPILTAANAIIAANPNRPEKEMWTERSEGPKIIVQETDDERKEAEEVIRASEQRRSQGIALNEQVVLYRTNAQSRLFEEACLRAGLPYRIVGGVKFYARREVKDVLAYLHILLNPGDTLSLLRVLNVPSRKIGETTLKALQAHGQERGCMLWDTLCQAGTVGNLGDGVKRRIAEFVRIIEKLRTLSGTEVVSLLTQHLLVAVGMEQWLRDETEEGEERWGNVQELLSVMHKYDTLDPRLSLTSFLEEAALVSEVDALSDIRDDALTLMTLHLCKGLEFEAVTITGCEEGIFPHSNSLYDKDQLEEERRLLYVGMTRAKTHLTITCARSRMLYGQTRSNPASRFLDDLPESVSERRSDDILSAFAWSAARGIAKKRSGGAAPVEPFRQTEPSLDIEFNQDLSFSEETAVSQEQFADGARIFHPTFGAGTIVLRRGDVVDIRFDSGERKSFALSIAPLRPL